MFVVQDALTGIPVGAEHPQSQFRNTPTFDSGFHFGKSDLGIMDELSHRLDPFASEYNQIESELYTWFKPQAFFRSQRYKPYLPENIQRLITRMSKGLLKEDEWVHFVDEICDISVKFFNIKEGKHIAIKVDGTVVESADSEINLLLKIQGRNYDSPIFICEAGVGSDSGWST